MTHQPDQPGIQIAQFSNREVYRAWVVDGLPCCLYVSPFGNLNGYVRLPVDHPDLLLAEAAEMLPGQPFLWPDGRPGINYVRGYDHVDVPVPGGWTYGPDLEGWVGFDTGHAGDRWSAEDRIRHGERAGCVQDVMLKLEFDELLDRLPPLPGDRVWTEEDVVTEVEKAARTLAERARLAVDVIRWARGMDG
jgi:hypothetical protein